MGKSWRDRLVSLFPADSPSLRLLSAAAAVITIATGLAFIGGIVFSESVRGAVSDFVTADVNVWHVLLTGAAVGIIAVWWARRRRGNRQIVPYPDEIEHFGVIWPIRTVLAGGTTAEFSTRKPACPKDRSTLGMAVQDEEDGKDVVVPLGNWWTDMVAERMRFGCFKDDTIYDLTQFQCGMETARDIVAGLAEGEYRTARARAREEADH